MSNHPAEASSPAHETGKSAAASSGSDSTNVARSSLVRSVQVGHQTRTHAPRHHDPLLIQIVDELDEFPFVRRRRFRPRRIVAIPMEREPPHGRVEQVRHDVPDEPGGERQSADPSRPGEISKQ